jgi:hypothetical protein
MPQLPSSSFVDRWICDYLQGGFGNVHISICDMGLTTDGVRQRSSVRFTPTLAGCCFDAVNDEPTEQASCRSFTSCDMVSRQVVSKEVVAPMHHAISSRQVQISHFKPPESITCCSQVFICPHFSHPYGDETRRNEVFILCVSWLTYWKYDCTSSTNILVGPWMGTSVRLRSNPHVWWVCCLVVTP